MDETVVRDLARGLAALDAPRRGAGRRSRASSAAAS